MQQIGPVTGEAVELDLRPAGFALRAAGFAIDLAVMLALLLAGTLGIALLDLGEAWGAAVGLVVTVSAMIGYPTLLETVLRGRTLGKLAVGTRAVREDGGPIRFRQALLRALAGLGELWLTSGAVALVVCLLHPRFKRVGDIMAGTVVLRERTPRRRPEPPRMPDALAAWARTADIGRIPPSSSEAARLFLVRAPGMHEQSRRALGRDLVTSFLRFVSPAPPPGTAPEDFLAAVIAERRRRDGVRLAAEADTHERIRRDLARLPFTEDAPPSVSTASSVSTVQSSPGQSSPGRSSANQSSASRSGIPSRTG